MDDPARASAPARALRLGAVDDHPVLLGGLRAELPDVDPGLRLVATAASVDELLATGERLDVVLLDLRLQDGSRPRENVERLVAAGVRVLVYTEGTHRPGMLAALAAGAAGVLRKDQPVRAVAEAVRVVASGEDDASGELAAALQSSARLDPHLSPRERQVLALYAAGLPAKSVARRLDVEPDTVKGYVKRAKAKYAAIDRAASTRVDLYQRAVEDGLVDAPDPLP